MALRIAREKVYLPLPIDGEHIQAMQGKKVYFLPISETCIPKCVINELMGIGSRAVARGLVIQDRGLDGPKALIKEAGFEVIYSVHCGIAMKNGVPNLRMSHIELLDFGLWWKKGKFYQHENERSSQ